MLVYDWLDVYERTCINIFFYDWYTYLVVLFFNDELVLFSQFASSGTEPVLILLTTIFVAGIIMTVAIFGPALAYGLGGVFSQMYVTLEGWLITVLLIFEPPHDKTNKMACEPSEDSDQPGHPPSLIRVFAVRSMGS